jgi:hypothetical protein
MDSYYNKTSYYSIPYYINLCYSHPYYINSYYILFTNFNFYYLILLNLFFLNYSQYYYYKYFDHNFNKIKHDN